MDKNAISAKPWAANFANTAHIAGLYHATLPIMNRSFAAICTLVFIVLFSTAGAAFDEIDQTGQKRFKSMQSCSGCHLLQAAQGGVVKMIGANLEGVNLRKLDLRAADLRRANMRGVNLQKVNLAGAKLKGALLHGANFQQANLQGAGLAWAILRGANLMGADLRGANLSRADLTNASMQKADLRGATLCRTIMPSGLVKNPDCQWWKIETPSGGNKWAAETAAPSPDKPSMRAPHATANNGPDLDLAAYLGRIFDFAVTQPDDRAADPR
jgi:uncharacterized protein YjbI with pentapeptide repeats